jgi:hypothetical protein
LPMARNSGCRLKIIRLCVRFGSSTAATRNGWRDSYAPNTGHEGGRSARRFPDRSERGHFEA